MFTGIVQGCVEVIDVTGSASSARIQVNLGDDLVVGLKKGASVSIDGVCLTAASIAGSVVAFDVIEETLRLTTLCRLKTGCRVNVERSYKVGDEIGGHQVSGHVHGTAQLVRVEETQENHIVYFTCPSQLMKYVFPKGFISLDGTSLTVVDIDRELTSITVHLIPETLRLTTFRFKREGDFVNIEVDQQTRTIVDTVELFLEHIGLRPPADTRSNS
jgi:riboflavin synthase